MTALCEKTELQHVVKRAQEGDSDAFATLFHTHKARVYSVCLRMTSNAEEAEDFTQDAFLQVIRKIKSFRGDAGFSTWLHRVAVNTVLMSFRKKSMCVSLDDTYEDDSDRLRHDPGTKDSNLECCVERIALTRVMEELPAGYRRVFVLHEIDGYEHQEIAEMLGCTAGNSKSQLSKAKRRIRELLAGEYKPKKRKKRTVGLPPNLHERDNSGSPSPIETHG